MVSCAVSQIGYWILREMSEKQYHAVATFHKRKFTEPVGREVWEQWDGTKGKKSSETAPMDAVIHCGPPHLAAMAVRWGSARGIRSAIAFSSTSIRFRDRPPPAGDPALVRDLKAHETAFHEACQANDVSGLIIRPTLIYGAGMDRNVTRLARILSTSAILPVPWNIGGLRQPVHAGDLASLALTAADILSAPPPRKVLEKAIEVGGGENLCYRDMIRRIAGPLGITPKLIPIPGLAWLASRVGAVTGRKGAASNALYRTGHDQVVDNGPARSALDYQPRPFNPTAEELSGKPVHPISG